MIKATHPDFKYQPINNPAEAPFLAVANVTNESGFFITCNSLNPFELNGTLVIELFPPNPVAQVELEPTNPTLGIIAFTIEPIVPWLPLWLRQLLELIGQLIRRLLG